jgi:phosphoribosylformylglycinamidine cyclo-ligase
MSDEVPALGTTLGEALLVPTKIYASAVRALLCECGPDLRALCHITGGGLGGNLPRVLPDGLGARLDLATFDRPPIFRVLAEGGPVDEAEMRRTFNLGVGMTAVVSSDAVQRSLIALASVGETAWVLGDVAPVGDLPFERRVSFA